MEIEKNNTEFKNKSVKKAHCIKQLYKLGITNCDINNYSKPVTYVIHKP